MTIELISYPNDDYPLRGNVARYREIHLPMGVSLMASVMKFVLMLREWGEMPIWSQMAVNVFSRKHSYPMILCIWTTCGHRNKINMWQWPRIILQLCYFNLKKKYTVNSAYNELLGTMRKSSLYPEFLITV